MTAISKYIKGFTLIELLIVVAIIAILLVIGLARFGTFGQQISLDTDAQKIISIFQAARSQTLGSEEESVWGVHLETNKYVLFKGATYDPASPDNKNYNLTRTEIAAINLTSGDDVVFSRIRGESANTGTVVVRLLSDTSKTKTIVINSLGQVSLQESVVTSGTRITDTRHLHLDLGWSIQGHSTMSLVFSDPPDPTVTENIDIADHLVGGTFNWEGSVYVNGDLQKLRIRSHFLDATNTILSVNRDRRYNTKALEIKIDGTTIVSYDAFGAATPGFISQMTKQ
jgi:prepilin-type N-terminal cleavage/methylation domain-containing protein